MPECEPTVEHGPSLEVRRTRAAAAHEQRGLHHVVRRYCRARLGRSAEGYRQADALADRVTTALVRDQGARAAGPLRDEAVVYAAMADAADRAVAGRAETDLSDGSLPGLDRLPRRRREVLVLRALVGLTAEQAARALGLTPDAVHREQHAALTALRSAG